MVEGWRRENKAGKQETARLRSEFAQELAAMQRAQERQRTQVGRRVSRDVEVHAAQHPAACWTENTSMSHDCDRYSRGDNASEVK